MSLDEIYRYVTENLTHDEIFSLIEDLCEDDDVMDHVYQKFEDMVADSGIWREWR